MNKLRTSLWFLILLTFLLVACGGIESGAVVETAVANPTAAPTAANPTTAPTEAAPTTAPTETAPATIAEPAAESMTLTDGLGRSVTLGVPAQRVVSTAPSNTEILFAVGAGDQVVGRDSLSDFPAAAQEVADIGGGFGELDVETIVSLDPDLVLAASLTPEEQITALADAGLTVYALTNPVDLEGMYENLRTVAQLTGHEAETEALVADLEERVTAVTEKTADVTERPLVFYEIDGTDPNAPWTIGPGSFHHTLLTLAGGDNVGASLESPWAQMSIEEIIIQDPDLILLGDYTWGGVTPEDVAAREGWDELTAVQNEKIYTFNDDLISRPGPRLVAGLEALAQTLHPNLFE